MSISYNKSAILSDKIFSILSSINDDPKTELEYTNLFTLLVAVSLSAQATDKSVNKATKSLFLVADSPEKMILLEENGLKSYINSIGLYNTKAKNIIKLSKEILEKFSGEVPLDFESLISLPGVGRKTANVILNCWLKIPTMPVDTHVFRVSKRIGLAYGRTPEQVEKELMKNIPQKWLINAHHFLILHGRYICKARKPECSICPISHLCEYYKNLAESERLQKH